MQFDLELDALRRVGFLRKGVAQVAGAGQRFFEGAQEMIGGIGKGHRAGPRTIWRRGAQPRETWVFRNSSNARKPWKLRYLLHIVLFFNLLVNHGLSCKLTRVAQFKLSTLRDSVNEGIARHGLRGYARKLGIDLNMLRSIRDGRDIQTSKLVQVIDAMGLRLTVQTRDAGARGTPKAGFAEPGAGQDALKSGFLPIPFHQTAQLYGQTAPVALSRDWLEARGLSPETLSFVIAPDAGLSPLVVKGALCLIDGSQRRIKGHAIWAYMRSGRLGLSYVSRPEQGLMVLSGLGQAEPPCVIKGAALDDLVILGPVVWRGAAMDAPVQD